LESPAAEIIATLATLRSIANSVQTIRVNLSFTLRRRCAEKQVMSYKQKTMINPVLVFELSPVLVFELSLIFFVVLLGPFANKKIEGNLEIFLFLMGIISATLSKAWSAELIYEGFAAPISITLAVLGAGVLFHYLRNTLDRGMRRVLITVPLPAIVCAGIIILGLLSSVISAIIAALLLVEFITVLPLHRNAEVNLTIVACFAIGLGAALTPLGEPLTTIVVSKLSGAPYHARFYYLFKLLALYVVPGVIILAIGGIWLVRQVPDDTEESLAAEPHEENLSEVFVRSFKVYVFVMALIFLGAGFKPLIDVYLTKLSPQALFWVNMVSAVLDNATLAAAEIGPSLSESQIKSALLGLLISGGMLIPGNIPNIIAAHALHIKSTEWARLGVALGLIMMIATAVLLWFKVV
jgi:predicted cation transporter